MLSPERHHGQFGEGVYDEIVLAATTLASTETGDLFVIERTVGLRNVTDGGVKLDAELGYDLLVSIFETATPVHDGAVVVRRHRIAAASCFLPLTLNPRLSKDLGTRHRAAIGVTEDTDAVAVVVSEETGLISFVLAGQIKRGLDATKLRAAIFQAWKWLREKKEKGSKARRSEANAKKCQSKFVNSQCMPFLDHENRGDPKIIAAARPSAAERWLQRSRRTLI